MRSKWVKYVAAVLAVGLLGALVAGCSQAARRPQPATPAEEPKTAVKAAMVTDIGGLGDKSFNDLSNAGLERAKSELGVETKVLESKAPTDYESNLTQLANAGYSPIFAVGFLMTDTVAKVSTATPDVIYGGVDEFFDPTIPNVVGLNFKEQEAGYLAGVLAGLADHQDRRRSADQRQEGPRLRRRHGDSAGPEVRHRLRGRREVGRPGRGRQDDLHGHVHRRTEGQ